MEQQERQAIGGRLRECRVSLRMTQEEVAALMDTKRQTVSAWENGDSMPRCEHWLVLGRMGVSLDYVVLNIRTVPVSEYAAAPMLRLPVLVHPPRAPDS